MVCRHLIELFRAPALGRTGSIYAFASYRADHLRAVPPRHDLAPRPRPSPVAGPPWRAKPIGPLTPYPASLGHLGPWLRENVYGRKFVRIFFLDAPSIASQGSTPDHKTQFEPDKANKAKNFRSSLRLRLP